MVSPTKRIVVASAIAGAVLFTGACGARSVDLAETNSEKVPGMGTMYQTCTPEGTLIYFTQRPGSWDESADYEAFFAAACYREPNGKIVVTFDRPVTPQASNGPIADGDLGNTQPGTEDEG